HASFFPLSQRPRPHCVGFHPPATPFSKEWKKRTEVVSYLSAVTCHRFRSLGLVRAAALGATRMRAHPPRRQVASHHKAATSRSTPKMPRYPARFDDFAAAITVWHADATTSNSARNLSRLDAG